MARGKSLSEDVRRSVIQAHNNGISAQQISISYCIPRSTVQDILNLYKKTGDVKQRKKTGRPSKISNADQRALRSIITTNQRSSSREITSLWKEMIGKNISLSTTKRKIKTLKNGTGLEVEHAADDIVIKKEDEPEETPPETHFEMVFIATDNQVKQEQFDRSNRSNEKDPYECTPLTVETSKPVKLKIVVSADKRSKEKTPVGMDLSVLKRNLK